MLNGKASDGVKQPETNREYPGSAHDPGMVGELKVGRRSVRVLWFRQMKGRSMDEYGEFEQENYWEDDLYQYNLAEADDYRYEMSDLGDYDTDDYDDGGY
jgi:hypothetical protein